MSNEVTAVAITVSDMTKWTTLCRHLEYVEADIAKLGMKDWLPQIQEMHDCAEANRAAHVRVFTEEEWERKWKR